MKSFLFLIVTVIGSGVFAPKLIWNEDRQDNCKLHESAKNIQLNKNTFEEDYILNRDISVTVHLVGNNIGISESSILNEFEDANAFFEPMRLKFKVCKIDSVLNHNYERILPNYYHPDNLELLVKHYEPRTLNVYYIKDFYNLEKKPNGMIDTVKLTKCSWYNDPNNDDDAIFLRRDSCGTKQGKILTKELGHFMGLYDTNENQFGQEFPDGTNCKTTGDLVCDTPADKFGIEVNEEDSCFVNSPPKINNQYCLPLTNNLMSNYPYKCKERFTMGQFKRMAKNYYATKSHLF